MYVLVSSFRSYSNLSNRGVGWNKRGGGEKVINKRGGWDFLEKTSTYITTINKEWRVKKI